MKAKISTLWNTGIQIITTEGNFDENGDGFSDGEISSFADLKKCENVLVEKQEKGVPFSKILIDNEILSVSFKNVSHPTGCGRLRICEIF